MNKVCEYCGNTFGPRANSNICFDCMPKGLTQSERNSKKKQLERKKTPIILTCPNCNEEFELPFGEVNRKYCFECMPKGLSKSEQTNTIRKYSKQKAIKLLGGKCICCDFNQYTSSLEFHHLDEDEKEFNIANRMHSLENEEMLNEVHKCVLLCSNCHRAYHANELEKEKEKIIKKEKEKKYVN